MALVVAVDGISVHELVKQGLCRTAHWIACLVACVELNTLYRENIQTETEKATESNHIIIKCQSNCY